MRCRGVRNANAYILVYDICCVESFEYVKMIRQQIVEHRYVPLAPWHRHHVFLQHADSLTVTFILTFLLQSLIPALFVDSFCFPLRGSQMRFEKMS